MLPFIVIENNFVDLSNISKNSRGTNDWINSIGKQIIGRFNNINYCFTIKRYNKDTQKIEIEYNGESFEIKTNYIISNNLNSIFNPQVKVENQEFLYEINSIVNGMKTVERRIEDGITNTKDRGVRTVKKKAYRRICITCGYDNNYQNNWSSESDMKKGNGCPVCAGQKVVEGINDIPTTAPWMIKYFQGGYDEAKKYTCHSGKKIRPICPDCGRLKDTKLPIFDIYRRNSIGCVCSDGFSYPEKFMYSLLTQLKIEFIFQLNIKQLRWCGNFKYDFYIPGLNMIIETHGKQHYDKDMFKSYIIQKQIDKEKRNLAIENGVKYYIELDCRISDLDYIKKSIYKSILNELLDISSINFEKCGIFASSNISKEVCKVKNEHPDYTTFQISDMFNISVGTIQRYLKNGNILGWCKYNPKEERIKANKKSVKSQKENQRAIVVKDENQKILGVFINAHRLSELSEKVFGMKLLPSNILESCRNDSQKSVYKNMTFDFVDDYIVSGFCQ